MFNDFTNKRTIIIIIVSIFLIVGIVIGFFLGRISINKPSGTNNNQPFQTPPPTDSKNDNDKPSNKKEEKVDYKYSLIGENTGYYVFNNIPSGNQKIFYISQNHPRIKELLNESKLQENKRFVIRYGKFDKESSSKVVLTFNEFNTELEIIES